MKSHKLFTQTVGGISGEHIELVEYDYLADYEKRVTRILKDDGFMKLLQEFKLLIEPATYYVNVWNAVM